MLSLTEGMFKIRTRRIEGRDECHAVDQFCRYLNIHSRAASLPAA
jgi:hypothetical protein